MTMGYATCSRDLEAPFEDLVSFAFDKQRPFDDETPLYIDADAPQHFLNYTQTRRYVRQLIAGLKFIGLQESDAVLVHLYNNYAYIPVCLAVAGAGGIFCGTNPGLRSEMATIVRISKPRFLITTPELLRQMHQWVADLDESRVIIFDAQQPEEDLTCGAQAEREISPKSLRSLLCHGEADWKILRGEAAVKSTPASYFLTSGTTGCPKLAILSHYSMVAHFCQVNQDVPYGVSTYVMTRFHIEKYLRYIGDYQITETSMSPPMVTRLSQLEPASLRRLDSLRLICIGGASITPEAMGKFRSFLHKDATLTGVYGATEAGTVSMLRYGEEDATWSAGRPLPGVKVRIDASGEVIVSSSSHMMRYRGKFEGSNVDVNWYRMGDLGFIKDGKLYISGKSKEIFKVNGFQVSPAEIESVVLQHPDVSDCAVSTIVCNGTEKPMAYVVRRIPTLTPEAVVDFSNKCLVSYKALTGGVCFVTQIPRLPSGKVQRYKLAHLPLDADRMPSYMRPLAWLLGTVQNLVTHVVAAPIRTYLSGVLGDRSAVSEKQRGTA